MSRMQVASFNDVKVYNLSAGKAVPQWLPERQRRNLAKDENYRRRVELIQDLDFPTASQRIKMSPDGQYVVATGTYPPAIRVYEVSEMSMKFERRLTAEVVDFLILSEDVGKLAFLQNDRTLAFHAPYGAHYATRIPRFGRSLAYHPPSCDLYVGASGPELYRLNLDEGRFRAPIPVRSTEGVNVLRVNPVHMLLAAGGEDGGVELIDPRSRASLTWLDMGAALGPAGRDQQGGGLRVTACEFDRDGLTFCVGTSSGHALLYDLRSPRALAVKEHQYGLPVVACRFHQGAGTGARQVLSADAKVVKIWGRDDIGGSGDGGGEPGAGGRGAVLTNVETPAAINDLCVVQDGRGDSGVLLLAGEQERVMTYYIPALGPAPRWCSFLDSITEELEEGEGGPGGGANAATVYDDYKFVTRQEVEELNATNLIGTPLLRGYMHGFFMDVNLYAKMQAVSQPAAYEEWRKKRVQERLEAKRAARISFQKKLPKVNAALAQRLLKAAKQQPQQPQEQEQEQEEEAQQQLSQADASNPLGDSRFASLFTREEFQVDEESEEFKLRNPNGVAAHPGGKRRRKRRDGSDSEGDRSDDDLVVRSAFRPVVEEEEAGEVWKRGGGGGGGGESDEGERSEPEAEEDELEVEYRRESLAHAGRQQQKKWAAASSSTKPAPPRKPKFMEADAIGEDGRAMLLHDQARRQGARAKIEERVLPLAERLKRAGAAAKAAKGTRQAAASAGKRGKLVKLSEQEGGGMVREYTYVPEQRAGAKGAAAASGAAAGTGTGTGGRGGGGGKATQRRRRTG